jgi:hypothetical protein
VQLRRRAHAPDVAVDDHDHRGRIDHDHRGRIDHHHRGSVHDHDHGHEHHDVNEHVVDLDLHEHQHVDVDLDQHHGSADDHDDATDVDDQGVDHDPGVDYDDRGDGAGLVERQLVSAVALGRGHRPAGRRRRDRADRSEPVPVGSPGPMGRVGP